MLTLASMYVNFNTYVDDNPHPFIINRLALHPFTLTPDTHRHLPGIRLN